MSFYNRTDCRICGEEIDTKAPSTLTVKQKAGKTFYMHDECFLAEQREMKKEAAEK